MAFRLQSRFSRVVVIVCLCPLVSLRWCSPFTPTPQTTDGRTQPTTQYNATDWRNHPPFVYGHVGWKHSRITFNRTHACPHNPLDYTQITSNSKPHARAVRVFAQRSAQVCVLVCQLQHHQRNPGHCCTRHPNVTLTYWHGTRATIHPRSVNSHKQRHTAGRRMRLPAHTHTHTHCWQSMKWKFYAVLSRVVFVWSEMAYMFYAV